MMSGSVTPIVRVGDILDKVRSYYADANLELIRATYIFSAQVHAGQTRQSGEPYLVHPVAVASILADMKLDEATVCTGLLHDTVEDTLTTVEDLKSLFGEQIASLVDGVTKISKMEFQSKQQRQAESFRKMILAMSQDIRVLLVKLADRLHNMRTMDHMPKEAQKRISQETMDIYGPLAGRLGIYWMRTDLEDLAFKYLDPDNYFQIAKARDDSLERSEDYVKNVLQIIQEKTLDYNITVETRGRTKEVYSIYRKMVTQNLDFTQIHDLTAFRIIANTVSECYALLGLIHPLWKPIPGRFKDYIAMPKGNGYRSLHTTVIGPGAQRVEVQIRTHEMDLVAENGIAAHWSYKEGKAVSEEDEQVIGWLRQVMEWQKDLEDPREFLENVRVDLFPDEVYVFTPKGEVKQFPKGSTPLDFAYSIHTQVGHRCRGARVNGKMVPLRYQLQTGDSVEIVTSSRQQPSKDWLKFVKTARARTKIRHYVLAEERSRAIEMGRSEAESELRRWKLDLDVAEKQGDILRIAEDFSFKAEQDLYASIGFGRISPKVVITKLVPPHERERAKEALKQEKQFRKKTSESKSGVRVEGLADVMVNFAKCCNPLPGDAITGYITRGRGVTIHKADCVNVDAVDSRRLVDVAWDERQEFSRIVRLGIEARGEIGLLAVISGVFSSNGSDIKSANVKEGEDGMATGVFSVAVKNLEHLTRIMNALKSVKGVEKVERLSV